MRQAKLEQLRGGLAINQRKTVRAACSKVQDLTRNVGEKV
jgi:hypothetical protein